MVIVGVVKADAAVVVAVVMVKKLPWGTADTHGTNRSERLPQKLGSAFSS